MYLFHYTVETLKNKNKKFQEQGIEGTEETFFSTLCKRLFKQTHKDLWDGESLCSENAWQADRCDCGLCLSPWATGVCQAAPAFALDPCLKD